MFQYQMPRRPWCCRLRWRATCFSNVWRQAASFKGRASISTWLLAIARYKALSARRARVDTELLDERITSTIADPADTPEAALQEKRRANAAVEDVLVHFIVLLSFAMRPSQ
jgi:DNA-directed RNA polymerase specialized sigma24 family protein